MHKPNILPFDSAMVSTPCMAITTQKNLSFSMSPDFHGLGV